MMEEERSKGGGHRQRSDYSDGSSNLRIGIRSGEERMKDSWQNDSNRLLEVNWNNRKWREWDAWTWNFWGGIVPGYWYDMGIGAGVDGRNNHWIL